MLSRLSPPAKLVKMPVRVVALSPDLRVLKLSPTTENTSKEGELPVYELSIFGGDPLPPYTQIF
jgi:hypothetical protein